MIGTTEAGQITGLQLYDGTSASPTVTIYYTNANGTGINSAYVYADPQVSSGTTAPMYYCVDLWHDNYLGSTYTINPVSSMAFRDSTFSDADNRIGWLLTQNQSTADARPLQSSPSGTPSTTCTARNWPASRSPAAMPL